VKFLLTTVFTFVLFSACAQRIQYLDANFLPVMYKEQATYYSEITKTSPIAAGVKTYQIDGTLFSEDNFSDMKHQKREGLMKNYFPDGKLKIEIAFKNGVFDGPLKTYHKNGQLKRSELYKKSKFIEGKCFTPAGADTIFYPFQVEPSFPGGTTALLHYIKTNIRNPNVIRRTGTSYFVVAKFMVTREGDVSDVMITQPLSTAHDREVMRLLTSMPKWIPGFQDGEKVGLEFTLPVEFKL
jgi:hypothetical protein